MFMSGSAIPENLLLFSGGELKLPHVIFLDVLLYLIFDIDNQELEIEISTIRLSGYARRRLYICS